MRKVIAVVTTSLVLICFFCLSVFAAKAKEAPYNEAEEAAKRVVNEIEHISNLVSSEWDGIELNGLYVRLFDEITEAVQKEGEIKNYQIVEIRYSDDNQYFSIKVKPTVYKIKKGDTLTKIAKKKGTTVDNLLEMNPEITDPNLIYEGDTLKLK